MNLSPAVAEELQMDMGGEGVVITEVEENSIASRVGLQKGDLVLAVNGTALSSTKDLERVVKGGGYSWEVSINRRGQVLTSQFSG